MIQLWNIYSLLIYHFRTDKYHRNPGVVITHIFDWFERSSGCFSQCETGLSANYNNVSFLQFFADLFILVATNIAGLCMRFSSEVAQRKAFSETRECIEARIKTQKEIRHQVIDMNINIQNILLRKTTLVTQYQPLNVCSCLSWLETVFAIFKK